MRNQIAIEHTKMTVKTQHAYINGLLGAVDEWAGRSVNHIDHAYARLETLVFIWNGRCGISAFQARKAPFVAGIIMVHSVHVKCSFGYTGPGKPLNIEAILMAYSSARSSPKHP